VGGAGYIGSHAVRWLGRQGHDVWAFDNLSTGHAAAVPVDRLIVGNLGNREQIEAALRQHRPEAVLHYAAFCYVGESVKEPEKYWHNNVVNALHLLAAMRSAGVRKFVFSSSCATYGIPKAMPMTEAEGQQPINPYGRTKLVIEWALADYAAAYGLGYAALRYFNASGASPDGDLGEDHDPETHLIPLALQVALGQRSHLEVFGTDYPTPDGTCIRDYIHVDDLAEAHALALAKLRPGQGLQCNLGIGKGYSVRDVIRVCEQVSGRPIAVKEGPRRAGDPAELVADAAKARRELGWQPRYASLEAIVETAWRWHKGRPRGYGA
jgi:UDP-glucose-4-epimerase GalE